MLRRLLAICLGSAFLALSLGCVSKQPEESSIPWSRPASWEGGIPGMGSPGMR